MKFIDAETGKDTAEVAHYEVIDKQTSKVVGTYKTRAAARKRSDKLDNAYGAYRYIVKPVWAE